MTNTIEDIQDQYDFGTQLNKDIKATTDLIENIEKRRAVVQKAIAEEKVDSKKETLLKIEDELYRIESGLFDIKQTGARQDNFRNPVQVLERFLAIGKELLVASGDHAPTNQQREVYTITKVKLSGAVSELTKLLQSAEWKSFDGVKP
jgi:hypothetical protein